MQAAAAAQLTGRDGLRFLATADPADRLIEQALIEKSLDMMVEREESQAVRIANRVGEMLGGKKRG